MAPHLVLVLGVLLTALVATWAHRGAQARRDLRLAGSANQITNLVLAQIDVYVTLLRSCGSYLQERPARTPEAFRQFINGLGLETHYRGVQGVGFAQRVEREAAAEFVALRRERGRPDFQLWPDITAAVGYPIVLLEPEDPRNLAAIGFDMFSEPVRHAAMARAAATGEPAASGKVTLVQEIDANKQAGFLIYLPVYRRAGDPDGPMTDLLGFSYAPFRSGDLFDRIFRQRGNLGLAVTIYDGTPAPDNLLFSNLHVDDPDDPPEVHVQREVNVAGRTWTLLFTAEDTHDHSSITGWWVAAAGLLVTLLLVLLVWNLERKRAETERHTFELLASEQRARDNESRKQAIFDAAFDAIITIDAQGRIVEFNHAAEQLFGRTRADVAGKPFVEITFPARFHEQFALNARLHLANNARDLVGRRVELVAARADGSEFPVEIGISRVPQVNAPLFTAFVRDITQRVEADAQIRELNENLERRVQERTTELEDANLQLESFSYSVSHDLRAPARHVLGYAELLKKQLTGWADPNVQRLVRVITESAGRMAHLIDDLLAFSRTSRQELRRQRVEMQALVEETIRALAPEIGARSIEWRIGRLPGVDGDRSLLAQVWTNLLSNAVKYTRRQEAPVVVVSATEHPDEVTFSIEDNGTGFDMRYVGKLFGVFSRLHREEEFEGTGIGLANVARIVQRHGGRVWAHGETGVGATFCFSLPRAPRSDSFSRDSTRPFPPRPSREPWNGAKE